MPSSRPLHLALVGVSGYGRVHLEMARHAEGAGLARLAAVVVVNQAAEAAACAALRSEGRRVYPSFGDMIAAEAGRLDLVLLPVPIHLHADMTCAALAAGAHVLVEKPLAASEEEMDRIDAAAALHRRRVFVGFQDLYASEIHALKAALVGGALGALRSIRGLGCWPRPASYYARNGWAGRLAVDGRPVLDSPLNNAFAHFVMLSLFFAGERADSLGAWTSCEAELYRAQPIQSFDTAGLRLRFARGVEALWLCTHSAVSPREPALHFVGDAGEAVWRFGEAAVLRPRGGAERVWPSLPLLRHRARMLEVVLRVLRGEPLPVCTPAMARAHARLVLALHAHAAVTDIPEGHLVRLGAGEEAQIAIRGVEPLLDACLASGALPSEQGAPWSSPAARFFPSPREEPVPCGSHAGA